MHTSFTPDPHSFARPQTVRVTHLAWVARIDFESRTIHASATWTIERQPDATVIILDTKGLLIRRVDTNERNDVRYLLGRETDILGQSLQIPIAEKTHTVTVVYETSPAAVALQWLTTTLTDGTQSLFLFTQSQAILARSWIPCQDSPGVRFTYRADVTVPPSMMALMSASNAQELSSDGHYHFEMKQPIPSYLLALAVGNLVFHPVSNRTGIYASPQTIDAAAWEFADLEKMITAAESLYGPYAWERYDLLVLPASFPFGGMENPRLTFVTPTILAGDRSLTSLIAHELAHSWSGNLVTNATWNDFWLNEGFTVYFETRIMEKLYGRDFAEMLMSLNLQDLLEEIESLRQQNLWADTRLKLDLSGRNPDDGVTEIAYNKGYFFLYAIEKIAGRELFDRFITDYFRDNSFRSMDTERFLVYVKNYFRTNAALTLDDKFLNAWIYTEGLPEDHPRVASMKFTHIDTVVNQWPEKGLKDVDATTWSTHEWLHFLKHLPSSLSQQEMDVIDDFGRFTDTGNAEIMAAWGVLVIRFRHEKAYPAVEGFLIKTGRRKFLGPLYQEMLQTSAGTTWAKQIYARARPGYHFVATNTFDNLIGINA